MSRTQGIDVSAWQNIPSTPQQIDWKRAADAGARFVFIRAAYIYSKDADYDYNWRESKAAGLLRGAYHFPTYQMEPREQARWFWNIIKDEPGELPPVLDIEQVPGTPLPSGVSWMIWIQRYLDELEQLGKRKPVFYSNPNTILNVLQIKKGSWLTKYPLWIAHYGAIAPIFRPWEQWTFWQYSSTGDGKTFGMESKGLDMNWFNGSEDDLRIWAGIGTGNNGGTDNNEQQLSFDEMIARLWEAHPELH